MASTLWFVLLLSSARTADAIVDHDHLGPVLVTGATGRTGSYIYNMLKEKGVEVRGFVRSAEKARERLNCSACDSSDGIFIGDVTKPETLGPAMEGVRSLAIAVGAPLICNPYPNCSYPEGAYPIDVDWHGALNQLDAFGFATNATGQRGQIALISTFGTTEPDDSPIFQHDSFYKLNFEASLMASEIPFTIVKPCELDSQPQPGLTRLIVGHNDQVSTSMTISRVDVARVMVAAVTNPQTAGLRFDLCASSTGSPTTSDNDLLRVMESARSKWSPPTHMYYKPASVVSISV